MVYTDYRPVPLQHYIFPAGADGVYLVKDEKVGWCMLCVVGHSNQYTMKGPMSHNVTFAIVRR